MTRRIRLLIFFFIILLGGATLCATRWNAWFSNPAEPTYIVPDGVSCVMMTYDSVPSVRHFSWRTADNADSCSLVLTVNKDSSLILGATGEKVLSRSGEAYYYYVTSPCLSQGQYSYYIQCDADRSATYTFHVAESDSMRFILFGDLHLADSLTSFAWLIDSLRGEEIEFFAYTGDIINRPMDKHWQTYFSSLGELSGAIPHVASVGNHEYLKGICGKIDSRWPHVFHNPTNGPQRFEGTTYYVDFPQMRMIVLNTQALFRVSDYTVTLTWLNQVLAEAGDKWKVVVMHHPIHSAAMNRDNVFVHAAFHHAVNKADLVVAGHDHVYCRRADEHKLTNDTLIVPVLICTSSAEKYYLPKVGIYDQRVGSNRSFYEDITVTADTLYIKSCLLPSGEKYDYLKIARDDRSIVEDTCVCEEILEIPDKYLQTGGLKVRRSINRIRARKSLF